MLTIKDWIILCLWLMPLGLVAAVGDSCDNCLPSNLVRHYESRGCRALRSRECNCALYYDCDNLPNKVRLDQTQLDKLKELGEDACIFNEKVYAIDEQLDIKCRVCHCREGTRSNVTGYWVKGASFGNPCAEIECPDMLWNRPEPGCHHVYSSDKCCAVDKICADTEPEKAKFKCNYGNRTFNLGQKIFLNEEPCTTCICDEKWNQDKFASSTCFEVNCNNGREIEKPAFTKLCTPVFFKTSCCPLDYICPSDFNPDSTSFKPLPSGLTDRCVFNEQEFKIGEKKNFTIKDTFKQGFGGGECQCRVPPLMTCLFVN